MLKGTIISLIFKKIHDKEAFKIRLITWREKFSEKSYIVCFSPCLSSQT